MRLDGKVASLTGSGQGIGQAIANRFAEVGTHVIGSDIVADRYEPTAKEIKGNGGWVRSLFLAVADESRFPSAFEQIVANLGGVDDHVNNASVGMPEVTRTMHAASLSISCSDAPLR